MTPMEYTVREWLNLALRWFHVFAGILWIGATWFFTWLDRRFEEAQKASSDGKAQVWMVHSGGFYIVDKQKVPEMLPQKLHWFKWEAALTWISGILLLILVYYLGGLLVDSSVRQMSNGAAIGISVALIIGGWILYDLFWISPAGKNDMVGAVVCYIVLVALIYGVTRIFAARAAYMQVGAMLGTFMAANVWQRILPAQRQLLAATREGRQPDMTLAARAKQRSKHNTFMVMPVVLIMISNHFPIATYGHQYNWAILAGLVLVGWAAAKIVRDH